MIVPFSVLRGEVHEHGLSHINEYPRCRRPPDVPHVIHAPDVYGRVSFLEVLHQYTSIVDEGAVRCSRIVRLGVVVSLEAGGRILHRVPGDVHLGLFRVLCLAVIEIVGVT